MKVVKGIGEDALKLQHPRYKNDDTKKIEVEYEYQEAETLADCVTWAGGEQNVVDFFNAAAHAKAINTGKQKEINSLGENHTDEQIMAAVKRFVAYVRDYVPSTGRTGASASKFVNELKVALAGKDSITKEDLAELAKQFGISV